MSIICGFILMWFFVGFVVMLMDDIVNWNSWWWGRLPSEAIVALVMQWIVMVCCIMLVVFGSIYLASKKGRKVFSLIVMITSCVAFVATVVTFSVLLSISGGRAADSIIQFQIAFSAVFMVIMILSIIHCCYSLNSKVVFEDDMMVSHQTTSKDPLREKLEAIKELQNNGIITGKEYNEYVRKALDHILK